MPACSGHVGTEVLEVWLVVDDPVDDLGQEAGFGLKRGPLVGGLVVLFAPRFGPVPESLDWWPRVSGSSVPSSVPFAVRGGRFSWPILRGWRIRRVRHGFTTGH